MSDVFQEHVIAAIDVDTLEEVEALAGALSGVVTKVKVGSRLFTAFGPRVLDMLGERGFEVFLDLKFHDIPSVVGDACRAAARHDAVFLMTVHASGGAAMVRAAAEGAGDGAKVVAVTALTSLEGSDLGAMGVAGELGAWVERLGSLAVGAGADGLVCSALEAAELRARHPDAVLVTPGIRSMWARTGDDQRRVLTPREALDAGSTYLVIGRPIYKAGDPRAAALRIAEELA